jgi:hypothetical protein
MDKSLPGSEEEQIEDEVGKDIVILLQRYWLVCHNYGNYSANECLGRQINTSKVMLLHTDSFGLDIVTPGNRVPPNCPHR